MSIRTLFLAMVAVPTIFLLAPTFVGYTADPVNLVQNGEFSQTKNRLPVGWNCYGDQTVTQKLDVVLGGGKNCARLVCSKYDHSSSASHAMLAQVGIVAVEQGKWYAFSCRAREENLQSQSVSVGLRDTTDWTDVGLSCNLIISQEWNETYTVFQATRTVSKTSRLQFWFTETGTFYLTDVSIVEITPPSVEYTDVIQPGDAKNLVPNGSFEVGTARWCSLGEDVGWGNLSYLHGTVEPTGGTEGSAYLRVPLGRENTPVEYFDYQTPVVHREWRPLVANYGWIPVQMSMLYTISCDMRASVAGTPAVLGVIAKDPEGAWWENRATYQQTVTLTTDWKRYTYTFTPEHRYVFVTVGSYLSQAAVVDVDIDGIQLEKGAQATPFAPRDTVEVGITPSAASGIFTQSDPDRLQSPGSLQVRAYNAGTAAADVTVNFQVTDFYDAPVHLDPVTINVAAGARSEKDVALPADWMGYYRVRAQYVTQVQGSTTAQIVAADAVVKNAKQEVIFEQSNLDNATATFNRINRLYEEGCMPVQDADDAKTAMTVQQAALDSARANEAAAEQQASVVRAGGKTEALRDMRLAIVPPRSSDDSVLGVNHAFCDSYQIGLAGKAGVTWFRDWSLKWQDIEPTEGVMDWSVGDAQIDRVVKNGAHLMALLPPFPSSNWDSEAPAGVPNNPGDRLRQAWAPRDPAKLDAFIGDAVARYKDRVNVWEFLNEPIFTDYALPGPGQTLYGGKSYTPADYVALLKPAAAAMKKSDPTCRVIGGMAAGPERAKEMIDAGVLDSVDILNLHMYPSGQPEAFLPQMDNLLALMDQHGGRKPIWVTEFSYYAEDDLPRTPYIPAAGEWTGQQFLKDERQCAEWTVRFMTIMLARGVEKVFLHSGANPSVNEPVTESCLFAGGAAPRRPFPALATFTALMGPKPQYVGEKRFGTGGYCFAFETGKQCVLVLWSTDLGGEQVRSGMMKGLPCYDLMGKSFFASQGLLLTTTPVYVVAASGIGKALADSMNVVP